MGVELILVLVILTNLKLLGSSRLGASIRVAAVQGVLLGLLPLLVHAHAPNLRLVLLTLGTIFLKGVVFPRLLIRALREADVSREVEPFIGYGASILMGLAALVVSFWLGGRLPLASEFSPLLVPVAIFSIFAGFFLIVGRMRAVSQVLGFLTLENGIYAFGVGVMEATSFLVELGVLLDVFVAVFIMGIMIFHINREFDHIDTDQLSALKD
jgi:hydrogenase-4 component E